MALPAIQGSNPNLAMFAQMANQQPQAPQAPQPGQQLNPQQIQMLQQMMAMQARQGGQQGAPQMPQGQMRPPTGVPPQGGAPMPAPQPGMQQPPQMPPGPPPQAGMAPGAPPMPGMMPPAPPTQTPQGQQIPPGMNPQIIQQLMQSQQPNPQLTPRLPPPGSQGAQSGYTPQEMAALGQMGDSTIAHLTPGEMTVPPELQSPKVLATLNQAYKGAGVSPAQFTAGSHQASINPATGAQQFSLWSSLLPVAAGLGASIFAPELLPMIGVAGDSAAGAAALGGLGTAAGGLIGGQTPQQALIGGLGAGLGGYAGGQIFGGGASAAGAGSSGAASPTSNFGNLDLSKLSTLQDGALASGASQGGALDLSKLSTLQGAEPFGSGAASAASGSSIPTPGLLNLYGALNGNNKGQLAGNALGGMVGSSLGAPSPSVSPQSANNKLTGGAFNQPYKQPTQGWQELMGQNTYTGPRANFNGYNAANGQQATGWNFFPPAGQPQITPPATM